MSNMRSAPLNQSIERTRRDPLRFFRDTYAELRKVTWPSRQEAVRLTAMVLVISACVGVLLGVIDYLFTLLFTRFLVSV